MSKPTDVRVTSCKLYFLPLVLRVPLKFGGETITYLTNARVRVGVTDGQGKTAYGWGETPLSVTWVWPSKETFEVRHDVIKTFCSVLAEAWAKFPEMGHPMEIGHEFQEKVLPGLLEKHNAARPEGDPMPWLGALVCCSPFDLALHDAYGNLVGKPVYETYNAQYMNRDLSAYLTPAPGADVSFAGKYPQDYFVPAPPASLRTWHLVGGLDLLTDAELTGAEPKDGYPVVLTKWIKRDGLKCLKIKLRGNNEEWDYQRIIDVGTIAIKQKVEWLSPDFNCTVANPKYVTDILDKLAQENPRIYGMILYVEQPFPYDLEKNRIDVHAVSARKPLFMDESAHDWHLVGLGRSLGWTGVALKVCKTQTGALLTACWAKAHGMTLMVQDLTNPMLAIIPHYLLAAYVGTIMGVEVNAMQFYPKASKAEEKVHGGLYKRRDGVVKLDTVTGPGFGYRADEIKRKLPKPVASFGK